MMKRTLPTTLLTLIFLFSAMSSFAQKKKKGEEKSTMETPATTTKSGGDDSFEMYNSVYKNGLRYNDLAVSTDAVYAMIALKPERRDLLDTLAVLYFQRSAWVQTILVTTDILNAEPNKATILELRAVSRQTIGMPKQSLEDYEKLYGITKNPYHLYEISTLQFTMRRFGEAEQSVGALLSDESLKEKKLVLTIGDKPQEIPFPAACLNLMGVLKMEQGQKPQAKEYFEAALKFFPGFELAKNNILMLEGKLQPQK